MEIDPYLSIAEKINSDKFSSIFVLVDDAIQQKKWEKENGE